MLQKCSIMRVAAVFFKEPTQDHYLIEISKKANLAHTAVKIHLLELKNLSIITEREEIKGKRRFPLYKANLISKEYRRYKKDYNLLSLKESKLIEFLKDNLMPKSIVLFGSYQKGEDTETSDIDLFVECKEEKISLNKFVSLLGRNFQLHFKDNFKRYPSELKNNIVNGSVLDGYLEAF